MPRFQILLLVAAIAGTATSYGCYTMLRHPDRDPYAEGLSEDLPAGLEAGDPQCLGCHTSAELSHWNGGSWRVPYYDWETPWAWYYQYPWWYDDCWTLPGGGHTHPGDASVPDYSGGRNAWDRGPGSIPPPAPSLPNIGGGMPSPSGGGAQPSNPGPQDNPPADNPPPNPPDPPKDKGKEEDKRHGWRR